MTAADVAPPADRLSEARDPAAGSGELRVRCLGVPESARARLEEVGVRVVEDPDAPVETTLVSTRLPPEDLSALERQISDQTSQVVVLAHTGAERLAAQLVSAGAQTMVGEGNEEALLGLVDPDYQPSALLTSFERRFGSADASGRGIDSSTGLADRRTLEQRVGTLGDAGDLPRVALCKVFSDRWTAAQPDPVVAVQRRRLGTTLASIAGSVHAEVYATGAGEFGIVGPGLTPHDIEHLGTRLTEAAATFRDRGLPLRLIIGHAGPESSPDAEELLQLARRALEVASADGARQILGAEDLAQGVSVTTELEATVRLLDEVEPLVPEGRGHGERVGRITAELARLRGWSTSAVVRAQLAGHLHDAGRAGLPTDAIGGPGELTGELLEAWRTFPTRTAGLLRVTAGPVVAASVQAQRERWDGEGFPLGLRSTEIPESARMLAVAHEIDELVTVDRLATTTLVQRLRERAGTALDPELVDLAIDHLSVLLAART
jgi:hypothetical protein